MSEIWLLLAIACVFSTVLLVGFALDASSTERKRAVRLLENQVSGSHRVASANLREHELTQSFGDRVLVPFVGRAGRVARRITPLDAHDRVAKKLLLAGSPEGWDAERVIAFKVIGAGGAFVGSLLAREPAEPRRPVVHPRASRSSRSPGSWSPTRSWPARSRSVRRKCWEPCRTRSTC